MAMFNRVAKPVARSDGRDDDDDFDDENIALKGRIAELSEEKRELKNELKEANKFIQSLCMQLIENSKAVNIAAASKPSAIEAYLANKNASATQSPKDLNKSANGSPKLPG